MGPTARPLWFGTSQLAAVKVEMASRRHPVSTNDFNDVNVDDCKISMHLAKTKPDETI